MSGRSHPRTFLLGTSITFSAAQSPFCRRHRREHSVIIALMLARKAQLYMTEGGEANSAIYSTGPVQRWYAHCKSVLPRGEDGNYTASKNVNDYTTQWHLTQIAVTVAELKTAHLQLGALSVSSSPSKMAIAPLPCPWPHHLPSLLYLQVFPTLPNTGWAAGSTHWHRWQVSCVLISCPTDTFVDQPAGQKASRGTNTAALSSVPVFIRLSHVQVITNVPTTGKTFPSLGLSQVIYCD